MAVVDGPSSASPTRRFPDLGAMSRALLAGIGATPLPEQKLDPQVRKRGYELNFAEARRMLADEDLSGALDAARRAQTLEPTRTGIVALIKVIEERLRRRHHRAAPGPAVDVVRGAHRADAHREHPAPVPAPLPPVGCRCRWDLWTPRPCGPRGPVR